MTTFGDTSCVLFLNAQDFIHGECETTVQLPNNWDTLTTTEQRKWFEDYVTAHYGRVPEPIIKKFDSVNKGALELKSGATIHFEPSKVKATKKNPELEREFEGWVGKWLITVFHAKSSPQIKVIGISNPSSDKWIAQELSSPILRQLCAITTRIDWKYGIFHKKKRKKGRKI